MIPNSIREDRKAILQLDDKLKQFDLLLDLRKKLLNNKNCNFDDIYNFIPKDIIEEFDCKEFIFKGDV